MIKGDIVLVTADIIEKKDKMIKYTRIDLYACIINKKYEDAEMVGSFNFYRQAEANSSQLHKSIEYWLVCEGIKHDILVVK